jgi:hypothetical protein
MTMTACRSAGRRFDDPAELAVARAFEAMRAEEDDRGRSRRRPDWAAIRSGVLKKLSVIVGPQESA